MVLLPKRYVPNTWGLADVTQAVIVVVEGASARGLRSEDDLLVLVFMERR